MDSKAIEIDNEQGSYKTAILVHFFIVSIIAISANTVVLGIIAKKVRKGASVDLKLSAVVVAIDFLAAIGTFIRAIICQSPNNLLVYSSDWCKFDALFTTLFLLFSGISFGVLSLERLLLVCYNKKASLWLWIGIIAAMCVTQYSLFAVSIAKNRQRVMSIAVYCNAGLALSTQVSRAVIAVNNLASYLMVVISYISIMIFRYKQSMNQLSLNLPKEQVIKEFLSTVSKSLINLILYMVVYFGKLYCILYEVSTGNTRTWLMDYISTFLISCSLIVNISVLLYMNIEIRKEFLKCISCLKMSF